MYYIIISLTTVDVNALQCDDVVIESDSEGINYDNLTIL